MWARNLLFIGLVGGGLVGLRASLFTLPAPPRSVAVNAATPVTDDFQAVVARVDAAFREDWKQQGLKPASRASDLVVARRLALALTGASPSLQEIRQLETVPAKQRVAWWTATLLQDRRHADYWAERLARAYVGTEDGPFIVYRRGRFVSWLSDELHQHTPYGDIVRQLIASEGLWTDRPAVNFISVTVSEAQKKGPDPERLAGRVARAFLGFRLDCAQCHDFPGVLDSFRPDRPDETWRQTDFQGLAAFFGQTWRGIAGIYDAGGDYEMKDRKTDKLKVIAPAVPFLPELLPAQGKRRERLAQWVTHPQNPYFARAAVNRVWALMFGRPLLDTVEPNKLLGEYPLALEALARDFTAHNYDLRRLVQLIAATEVFQLDSAAAHDITDEHELAWAVFPMTRLRPEQVAGSVLQAASVQTVDDRSNVFVRIGRFAGERDFVRRYGDTGEDEFDGRGGTIPQRLILLNGDLVEQKTRGELANAVARIALLAPDDRHAVDTAYLAVLTRRPTAAEADYFARSLEGKTGKDRNRRLEDLYWALINSTEFSWNH
jgi:Protein of unknown function (DUF1553)/Protein of unknown function (DUF1549)